MKWIVNYILSHFFDKIFYAIALIFDRHLLHRVQFARGRATLTRVKAHGDNVLMHGYSKIIAPENFIIGSHVRIGAGCYFNCLGGVNIGNNTQLSRGVVIYSANHDYNGSTVPYDNNYIKKSVSIGESVWIGMGVCIMPGVTIGDGAIIGMGTIISKDVPAYAIVVGSGQRIVKCRDSQKFIGLNSSELWFGKIFPNE